MRLFVAVEMPKDVKDYLFNVQKKVKGSNLAKVNWVAKKNLHLTLKFLGSIDDSKVNLVRERLGSIKFKGFKAHLTKVGVFPSESFIKVVFVGCDPAKNFLHLEQKVDEQTLDLSKSDHAFVSHVTLGRVKNVKKKKEFIEFMNKFEIDKLEFTIDFFVLMSSVLRREGPQYKVVEKFSLI